MHSISKNLIKKVVKSKTKMRAFFRFVLSKLDLIITESKFILATIESTFQLKNEKNSYQRYLLIEKNGTKLKSIHSR